LRPAVARHDNGGRLGAFTFSFVAPNVGGLAYSGPSAEAVSELTLATIPRASVEEILTAQCGVGLESVVKRAPDARFPRLTSGGIATIERAF
jgi:hypothetical protein